ncbi:MAG TPA: flagellar hook-basal body complex protein FliE [Rhodocyclaceae bacterium]
MDTNGIDQVLAQLRTTAASAAGKPAAAGEGDFSAALKSAIDQVNQAQQEGAKLSEKFAAGDADTNLHEVMLSLQKANVSFQEMIQVRNRLVSAYQDIMNMQV